MPIYEYRCTKCGHRFEAIQKVSDAPLNKCEKCKGRTERLVSSPAIQFKGSGWYITDYARKGAKDSGKDGSAADASKDGGSADKSASDKPAGDKPASKKKEKTGSGAK